MRHDLFGAELQMLHFIEHRIKHNVLRAGADDLLDFLCALRAAPPDRHMRAEVGILITPAKPLSNPPLSPRLVSIDRQIDSFTVSKCSRIAFCLIYKTSNHC